MSLAYVVRPGCADDLDACVALALLAAPEHEASFWRDVLLRDLEGHEHRLVVAESEGEVVGYGRARLVEPAPDAPPDTAPAGHYLTGVYVRPEWRRNGVATALTEARLDWIRERAADAWYFANARNTASIALHRRFGFEEVSRRFSFPGLVFEGGRGILFRLTLANPRRDADE